MENFVNYIIKELKKHINQYHYSEKDLDMKFVLYCEDYIVLHNKLPGGLYEHLSNLYWKYKED